MVDITMTPHAYAFPSKIKSGSCGHVFNVVCQGNLDNGAIRGLGAYVHFDQYNDKNASANFTGKIVDKATNGNFYVQVTSVDVDEPTVFIYEDPIPREKNTKNTSPIYFYNKAGAVVRGYELSLFDIFEVSAEAFTTTPTVGKTVTVANTTGKLVVGA